MSSSRKRVISSCMPCYTRKQKCNREYPCNHCSRRQCTEDCVYYSTTASETSSPAAVPESRTKERSREERPREERPREERPRENRPREERPKETAKNAGSRSLSSRNEWNVYVKSVTPTAPWSAPSLAESFGYFEDSDSNTLALIQKLGLTRHDGSHGSCPALISEVADEVHRNIKRMPDRQVLDFLVQYFVTEVNWMDQLVHAPWFLPKYQAWWMLERVTLVTEVDFAILILRICSYALQFLPAPGYTLDKIRGILLADIRNICDETADNLEALSTAADGRGSLIRVQYLAFFGLQCQIEGKTNAFWEVLSRAIRVAQNIGMHCDAASSRKGTDKIDREMERRTFCNLYIWDSLLSHQLDRIPFLSGRLRPGNWPQLHLLRNGGSGEGDSMEQGGDAPDPFIERLLQAHLADFWRRVGPVQGAKYDMVTAEERYDKFCREFLSQLPPAFALADPDVTWDKRFQKLPLQRKLLHIAIYDSICWNFRPLLLRPPAPLPAYKSVMLSCQKMKLAATALYALDNVTQLHALLWGCHTRLPGIVFSTFEAAVLLVYLYTDPMFPEDCPQQHIPPPGSLKTDPLQAGLCNITLLGCLQAVKGALKRLKMLAEVSSMADCGANTLIQLLSKASEVSARTETAIEEVALAQNQEAGSTITATTTTTSQLGATSGAGEVASWLPGDLADLHSVNDLMPISGLLAGGDMGSWPSFDTSNMFSQDMASGPAFDTSNMYLQDMEYWPTQKMDSTH